MDKPEDFTENTLLRTPEPTATSTVDRRSYRKKETKPNDASLNCDSDTSSLGILSLSNLDIFQKDLSLNTSNMNSFRLSDAGRQLEKQRLLANSSLEKARLSGLPSHYLKPNYTKDSSYNLSASGSTLNESDLLITTPQNNSTPRESLINDKNFSRKSRLSLGQSMAQLSEKISNPDIPLDAFIKEFSKTMNTNTSSDFIPAEEAQNRLLEDELSWRKKNELPITQDTLATSNMLLPSNDMSIGEFFQQKCETLSQFSDAMSPLKRHEPLPLIDSTHISNLNIEQALEKSLSISTIAKILESDATPRRAESALLNHGKGRDSSLSDQVSLPVSKNSSYTSNYSENDAIRCIVNKENVDSTNVKQNYLSTSPRPPSSVSSVGSSIRSTSTLSTLPNGKLPIESTKSHLIWGCVKLDRCVTQEFLIRNKSLKTLRLQLTVGNQSFRFRKENRPDSDSVSSMKIVLHPQESRPITIAFSPAKLGPAIDELLFTPLDPHLEQTKKQCIHLYGYGGFGSVDIVNITKDIQNKYWLSLGDLSTSNVLSQTIVLRNTGTLPSFVYLTVMSRELCAFPNVTLSNKFFTLVPNEQKEVTVTYSLSAEDYSRIKNCTSIVDVGMIKLVSGTEVNRSRLRRLCRKANEKNVEIDALSKSLNEHIVGEGTAADTIDFKEPLSCLPDILKLFTSNEIILTLEQDPEQTLIPQYPDDSALYQTLTHDATRMLEETICRDTCEIEPSSIILMPPHKVEDTLFLKSKSGRDLVFKVKSKPEGLNCQPSSGTIGAGETILLRVNCPKNLKEKKLYKLIVSVEGEIFEASVKTILIN